MLLPDARRTVRLLKVSQQGNRVRQHQVRWHQAQHNRPVPGPEHLNQQCELKLHDQHVDPGTSLVTDFYKFVDFDAAEAEAYNPTRRIYDKKATTNFRRHKLRQSFI